MSRFSSVIFDLDGTLTDPASGIAATIRAVLATLGVQPPRRAELGWCVGPPLREIFTRLLEPVGRSELVDQAAALYVQNYAQVGAAESTVYPGVAQMLTELRGAMRLFVVAAKSTTAAERVLGLCGLRRYFDEVCGNGRLDDKSDLIRELIERERLDCATTAIVGDRDHDIVAGKRIGIFTIGVAYGYGSREDLAAAGADRICESPAEVAQVLLATAES
jgi:phosphoglycolate phosphatase